MKKILLLVLVALVTVALVACGGETTTASTTTTTPTTTTDPVVSSTEPNPDVDNPGRFEGIDILNGLPEDMAINAYAFNEAPLMFEDHHSSLNYQWAMILDIDATPNSIYETLFTAIEEPEEGQDSHEPNNQFKWVVEIDGTVIEVTDFANAYGDEDCPYLRMGLGEWKPVEGKHTYEIVIKIYDVQTNTIAFYADFTDPEVFPDGGYVWDRPVKLGYVADPDVPSTAVRIDNEKFVIAESGPNTTGAESFDKMFDYDVNTKSCHDGDGEENAIIFSIDKEKVADGYNIIGISLVGANDDDPYSGRVVKKFYLYGADTNAEDTNWGDPILVGEDPEPTAVNFGERYFPITSTTEISFTYYKLVLENGETYQLSEIFLYCEQDTFNPIGG